MASRKFSSDQVLRVVKNSEYSIEEFVKRVSVNARGNPLLGDCLTYACVFSSMFQGDVFMIYVPDEETAENPMHASTRVNSDHYDARGKVSRNQLITDQVKVMKSDFTSYIDNKNINDLFAHVKNNYAYIEVDEATTIPDFNPSLYQSVYNTAESEIQRIRDGKGLTSDVTNRRGPDF